ncbi:gamma-glutamyltransferase [Microbispora sp. H13382]|uniref:gamma-glutamyltransferase n=1 Tax=Microbispora sp. H13382 TaxID=2729112 RepID=UPI0016005B0F|nr:gamma-glutamyltransferase [Microbispora sp. H13382]
MKSSMGPPQGSHDGVLKYDDAFDVPILVRSAPARRPFPQWRRASTPWPTPGAVPPPGWYLVTALWREIIKHSTEVGRDIVPWLREVPQLAGQELLARISPLQAYLSLTDAGQVPFPGNTGRRLKTSVVYDHGTERSAKSAFGYRIGMTMAQWACCGLMGLGETTHIESAQDPAFTALANTAGPCPDLCGRHPTDYRPWWLVEAKAGYKLGLDALAKGQQQLHHGSKLMSQEHRLMLCGTSLHEHVFMTMDDLTSGAADLLDTGVRPDSEDNLSEDTDALLRVTQTQLLTYLHLRYGSSSLRLIPLSSQRTARPRTRPGALTPLEDDPATAEARQRLRAHPPANNRELRQRTEVTDFVASAVGATGVHVGMSRRLFAACQRLFEERIRIIDEFPDVFSRRGKPSVPEEWLAPDDEEWVRIEREQRIRHREREYENREHIRVTVRDAYHQADQLEWPELFGGVEPALDLGAELLEGATAETYIGIRPDDPLLTSLRSR